MKMKIRFPKVLIWGSIAILLFALGGCPHSTDPDLEPPDQKDTEETRDQDSMDKPENKGQNSGDEQNDPADNEDEDNDEKNENDDDKDPDKQEDKNDEILVSGNLVIRIGEIAKSEGVYPDLSGVTRYLLDFNAQGGKTAEAIYLEPGNELTLTLDAGDWEIRAYGLAETEQGKSQLAVIFGITRVTVPENATETVLIVPDGPAMESEEQGFLSWNIDYPVEKTWEAGLTLSLKIEGDSFVPYEYFDLTAPGAKEQKISLPAGTYRMESHFSSHNANTGSTEIVHIFPSLETRSSRVTIIETSFPNTAEFSSVDELQMYLNNQPENTENTPYPVKIAGVNLSSREKNGETLKTLYDALNRYVTLDLRECTGTELISASIIPALEGRKKIVSLILPGSVTSITANGFSGYESLKSAVLPKVTAVGYAAFRNCKQLEVVSAPVLKTVASAKDNESGAFIGCTLLKTLSCPALTTLGDYALYKCGALETAVLPKAASIGKRALFNTPSLKNIVLGPVPPELGNDVFGSDFLQNGVIYVPASAVDAYKESPAWSKMQDRFYPISE